MKNLILLGLTLLSIQIFSQQMERKDCERYFKQTGLKYLECIYLYEKLDSEDKIYQVYKWSAFGRMIFTNIEKRKPGYFLISHEIAQPIYNEKTDEFDYPITVCQNRKLTKKESVDFENIINKYKFWEKQTYELDPVCSDGHGIVFQALCNGKFRNYSNGNCAPSDEYLNTMYDEIKKVLKL
ncbi:hypothetical protein [Chryseobacterium turcicum]|uniref:Uncharacterized protein n=1 Tax=Chryseobacterium turcicum TaxID=2898076 RepID=A0A9Q3V0X1_9FLAO|nr:hypothetical protein [Chryseobacterium turcicum]MCD1115310.1 hypothetical protein [Chryseobacterium turcicum]